MSSDQGTLELIAQHLTLALRPLRDVVAEPEQFKGFLYKLGWNASGLPPDYTDLAALVNDAMQKLEGLSPSPPLTEVLNLIGKVKGAFDGIQAISVAPPGVDAGPFLAEIRDRISELLLTEYIAAELPACYNLLQ